GRRRGAGGAAENKTGVRGVAAVNPPRPATKKLAKSAGAAPCRRSSDISADAVPRLLRPHFFRGAFGPDAIMSLAYGDGSSDLPTRDCPGCSDLLGVARH